MDAMSTSESSSSDDECLRETIEQLRYNIINKNKQQERRVSLNSNNNNTSTCNSSTTDALHKSSKDMYDSWCRPDTKMSTSLNKYNLNNSSNQSISNSAAASTSQLSIASARSNYSKSQRSVSAGPTNRIKYLSKNVINPTRQHNDNYNNNCNNNSTDKLLSSVRDMVDTTEQDARIDHQLQQSIASSVSTKNSARSTSPMKKNQSSLLVNQESSTSLTLNDLFSDEFIEEYPLNYGHTPQTTAKAKAVTSTTVTTQLQASRRTNKVTPYCPWTQPSTNVSGIREWVPLNANEIQVEAFAMSNTNLNNKQPNDNCVTNSWNESVCDSISNNAPVESSSRDMYNTMSPQDFLDAMIFQRGYSTDRYQTLDSGYYNEPTALQEASYTPHVLNLVDQNSVSALRTLLVSGLSCNPSNYSGSTLAHYVCRVGRAGMLRMLFEIGCDIRIADADGRTPLHELCKRKVPCFEMVEMIMRYDLRMFYMIDQRDTIPLGRVPKSQWAVWNRFLDSKKDIFWPNRECFKMGDEPPPPLTLVKPNTRIVPNPRNVIPIHAVQFIAAGEEENKDSTPFDGNRSSKDDSITWVDDWQMNAVDASQRPKKPIAASPPVSNQQVPSLPPTNIVFPNTSISARSLKNPCDSPIVNQNHIAQASSTSSPDATKSKVVVSVQSEERQDEAIVEPTDPMFTDVFTSIVDTINKSPTTTKPPRNYTISTTSTAATKTCTTSSTITDLTMMRTIDLNDDVDGYNNTKSGTMSKTSKASAKAMSTSGSISRRSRSKQINPRMVDLDSVIDDDDVNVVTKAVDTEKKSSISTKTAATDSYPHVKKNSRIVDLDDDIVDNDDDEEDDHGRDMSSIVDSSDRDRQEQRESRRERRRSKSISRAARSKSRKEHRSRSRRRPQAFYVERVAV